jgi:3-oxoacyl-[acyl-carrier-protein] synthase II
MTNVLVTGLGVVSPIGSSLSSYWEGLLAGANRPERYPWIEERHVSNPITYWVREPKVRVVSGDGVALGRASQFAIRAAESCVRDAGLDGQALTSLGISIGTGMGHADLLEDQRAGGAAVTPVEQFTFAVASGVASHLDLRGPNLSVSTACAAGVYSVSMAVEAIRAGFADVMLAGGAEGFSRVALGCFRRLGALDPIVCRPFDAARQGTVFGEGSAMLLLESEEHARRRGWSNAYATISGCGWSCDAHHPTAPEGEGQQAIAALRRALAEAGLQPSQIDCVVPHGTGTELNDVVESRTLAAVFGEHVDRLRIFGLKSLIGHTGGGAGAFSCLTAALMLRRAMVPATAHLSTIDSRCALPLHTAAPAHGDLGHVLVNAYAFGGNNISMIFGQPHVH